MGQDFKQIAGWEYSLKRDRMVQIAAKWSGLNRIEGKIEVYQLAPVHSLDLIPCCLQLRRYIPSRCNNLPRHDQQAPVSLQDVEDGVVQKVLFPGNTGNR